MEAPTLARSTPNCFACPVAFAFDLRVRWNRVPAHESSLAHPNSEVGRTVDAKCAPMGSNPGFRLRVRKSPPCCPDALIRSDVLFAVMPPLVPPPPSTTPVALSATKAQVCNSRLLKQARWMIFVCLAVVPQHPVCFCAVENLTGSTKVSHHGFSMLQ